MLTSTTNYISLTCNFICMSGFKPSNSACNIVVRTRSIATTYFVSCNICK